MSPYTRALTGVSVGISISESEDSGRLGFGSKEVNQVTVDFSRELVGQGASVVFGHDWRPDGVMHAVATAAAGAQPLGEPTEPITSPQLGVPQPRRRPKQLLRNYLPWPSQPSLSRDEREQLSASLYIEAVPLPPGLKAYETVTVPGPPEYPYLVARALTALRHRLIEETDARICIGGKEQKYTGRYPGIVEEAMFAIAAQQPLYLVGAFGGATQWVIDALEGGPSKPFFRDADMRDLYQHHNLDNGPDAAADREIEAEHLWYEFHSLTTSGLADLNGLSIDENRALFASSAIPTAIELVLVGLGRIRRRRLTQ